MITLHLLYDSEKVNIITLHGYTYYMIQDKLTW